VGDHFWSPKVAEAAVRAVVAATWDPSIGSQHVRDLIGVVASKMSKDLAASLSPPLLDRRLDDESRRILDFWYEFTTKRRRGQG